MRCPTCRDAGVDHDDVVKKCLSGPFWTGRLLFGFDKLSFSFHQNISLWLEKGIREGKRRFIILTPRDHFKTTLFGISTMAWFVLNDPETRILYMMSSCDQSSKKLEVVKDGLVRSEQLAHYFPNRTVDLRNIKTKWRSDYIRVPYRVGNFADGTIEARGLNSKVTGGHFTVHIFDDLIDETMVDSVIEQTKAIDFVKRSDALFVDIGLDIEIIIGTRWPGPFYDWLLEESGITEHYETLIIGCYVDDRYRNFMASIGKQVLLEDGTPIFPEHFKKEDLELIRKKTPFDFSHQWLNIRTDEGARRFDRRDFRYYRYDPSGEFIIYSVVDVDQNGELRHAERKVKLRDLYITMTIDPATGEGEKSDEVAISVVGVDRVTGYIFVLEDWARRALPSEVIDVIIQLAKKWNPSKIAPEDVAYQKTFKHFLEQEFRRRGVSWYIDPVKPGGQKKGSRIIDALEPFVRNNQIYFAKGQPVMDELVAIQVVNGKIIGRSPNRADALAYHAEFWRSHFSENIEQDIEYVDPYKGKIVPAYSLECLT